MLVSAGRIMNMFMSPGDLADLAAVGDANAAKCRRESAVPPY